MLNSRRCAACIWLRRGCPQDCIFRPYFSSTDIQRFLCVHKVYGASNVARTLKELPERLRSEAAKTMVFEAILRIHDPVYGSAGTITKLVQQIKDAEIELVKTQGLITLCHAQYHHHDNQHI